MVSDFKVQFRPVMFSYAFNDLQTEAKTVLLCGGKLFSYVCKLADSFDRSIILNRQEYSGIGPAKFHIHFSILLLGDRFNGIFNEIDH